MAFNTPPTKNNGDVFTGPEFNTYIRDNFAAGVPDIFTTKGDLAVATGPDAAARLPVGTGGQVIVPDSTQATGLKWVNGRTKLHATSTSWDGDAKAVGIYTINLNSVFGVPAAATSVFLWVSVKWASASDGNIVRVGPAGSTYEFIYIRGNYGANLLHDGTGEVFTNGGQIELEVMGANALEVYVTVQGYTFG